MGTRTPALPEILRGTLDLLILQALSWGPAHGYAVARWIQQATADALAIGEGTLYPALHRLEERGWISAELGRLRKQPPGEVLCADTARPRAAARRNRSTGAATRPRSSPRSKRRR